MPSSLSGRCSTQSREDDVPLGTSNRGPVGDAADRAPAAAADSDRVRSAFVFGDDMGHMATLW
jgi:hypothetical protein